MAMAAQLRMNTGQQLAQAEGLDQIIIRADLESRLFRTKCG